MKQNSTSTVPLNSNTHKKTVGKESDPTPMQVKCLQTASEGTKLNVRNRHLIGGRLFRKWRKGDDLAAFEGTCLGG